MAEPIQIPTAIDSTQEGVLKASTAIRSDAVDVLRLYLAAITGIEKTLVRKRWAVKPGIQPPVDADWASIGILEVRTDGFPYQQELKTPDVVRATSWQTLHCMASFYGPHAETLSDDFREGCQLPQNQRALKPFGLVIRSCEDSVTHVPDFSFEQWIDRFDVRFTVGRSVTRDYGVRSLVKVGEIELITERGKA